MLPLIKHGILFLLLLSQETVAGGRQDNSMSLEAITERLAPVGKVNIAGEQSARVARPPQSVITPFTGKTIYQRVCRDCHATGEVRSPRVGNYEAWAPRLAKGYPNLYENAINGFNFMPPKGTCDECSEAEVKAAVKYMVEQSIHSSKH